MAPEQARDATQASPASDIFSLGATLVYAATGHAPYQGQTVMDILVRLATEPPDLAAVPAELTELVTSCLARVPRDRPSDAAILAKLGQFDHGAGPGHSYLPECAMNLIADHHSDPLRLDLAVDDAVSDGETNGSGAPGSDGDTSGSHTALPGFHSVAGLRPHPGTSAGLPGGRRRRRPMMTVKTRRGELVLLPAWARAVAGVALICVGLGLGLLLRGPTVAPAAASDASPPASAAASAAGGSAPPAKPSCSSAEPGTTAELCPSQPFGDSDTVFVIHGSGYAPFTRVTIRLYGPGMSRHPHTSPDRPVTDRQGTFNYAIDQGHYFYSGLLPPGSYEVTVTAPGERDTHAAFTVYPANAGPPGSPPFGVPAAPPPGNPPPGAP
jgi:hypothetical protein